MPPKKKRGPTIVVGTVSTRSTRRQSVVNIEIPKLNRTNKVSKPDTEIVDSNESQEFTARIKKSYNEFLGTSKEISPPTPAKISNPADIGNKALLEILQDWDDIDEEESGTDTNVNKEYDTAEIIRQFSDVKQIELTLSQGLEIEEDSNNSNSVQIPTVEDVNINQVIKEDFVDDNKIDRPEDPVFEALKNENSTSSVTETEELIIEEQASIPFADDMVEEEQNIDKPQSGEFDISSEKVSVISEENSTAFDSNSQFPEALHPESSSSETSQPSREVEKIMNKNEESNFSSRSVDMEYMPVSEECGKNEEKPCEKYLQEETSNPGEKVDDNSENTKMEAENPHLPDDTVGSDAFMDHSGIESKQTSTFDHQEQSNDSIENRVAEMHLTEEEKEFCSPQKIEDTTKKFYNKSETSFEEIDKKPVVDGNTQLNTTSMSGIHTNLFLEDVANNPAILKPKSKKPKPKQEKFVPSREEVKIKTTKPKSSKSPTLKLKEKSWKESKGNKKPSKKDKKPETSKESEDDEKVRRSSRIKSISVLNKKTTGWGLVKSKSESSLIESDISDNSFQAESEKITPTASPKICLKDKKWKSNELLSLANNSHISLPYKSVELNKRPHKDPVVEGRLKQFVHLKENQYRTDRMMCKEAKKMVCDCFLTSEELEANQYGCGEDCLNRLLLIECGNVCTVGDRCTNKRFQKSAFAPVEVFNTDKKGLGLRAAANIAFGEFILEYVGEVLDTDEFDKRAEVYSQDKNIHYYFMALRADAIIDATMKGNISRFINHSCDPNAETQKWTVNGELRIGFFSTRTILAGEEITFDYRFQRYGKEAQKCYCGASICRGWLGEQPDSDEEEEDEEEEEEEIEDTKRCLLESTNKDAIDIDISAVKDEIKFDARGIKSDKESTNKDASQTTIPTVKPIKKKVQKKKPRIEMFEEVDQLIEEIEMLVTTGLKNQAHTLKVSRLMVRAKEPQQRAKLLRVLRRGELPCRRLFLDYHGLRLMHGYMIDAQQLSMANKQFESLRLEVLQTLAVLPIPNKSMLQDSKVLSTVELWASNKALTSPPDSDSNSPKTETDLSTKLEPKPPIKEESVPERSIEDQEEEIRFLATKLLEEWKNLKEVFRIPKKERIEQMKEHEREANKKFMQSNKQNTYINDDDRERDRKSDRLYYRYRGTYRSRSDRDYLPSRKSSKSGEKLSAEFFRLSRVERRKLFALQHELKEEERKLKQREMWREHEVNCMMIGADPRFTAPFDPSRGYQLIWNPQIGQWQNCTLPSSTRMYSTQHPLPLPPHHSKSLPAYPPHLVNPQQTLPPLPSQGHLPPHLNIQGHLPHHVHGHLAQPNPYGHIPLPQTMQLAAGMPPLPNAHPTQAQIEEDPSQVKFLGPIPPPVKLPPKWKCAKDKYGRPYYYHVKLRKSQWEPPLIEHIEEQAENVSGANSAVLTFPASESESSSETSSVSSDSSSENSDSDEDVDDTKLLLEVRKQIEILPKLPPDEEMVVDTPSPDDEKHFENEIDVDEIIRRSVTATQDEEIRRPSIDMRLKELELFMDDRPSKRKRRIGLCEEIIISPRTEEDKRQYKEDVKRYKANKEKLKRQREKILQQTKKQLKEIELKKSREKRAKTTVVKVKLRDKPEFNSEAAKRIKETFRTNMASTVVHSLNAYRKPDCTLGRITNTQDFKHLARKLTHFVMLKEIKHISKIEELTCTDNVKMKAREFIRKYMSKFGEVYVKRSDSPDFKD